jgi:hypothetical protein
MHELTFTWIATARSRPGGTVFSSTDPGTLAGVAFLALGIRSSQVAKRHTDEP